jgi:DNA-binding HxlR family transcriptional regulator
LADTAIRLKQLAFLSGASADLSAAAARELTALAPEAAVSCAVTLAAETQQRHRTTAPAPDAPLNAVQRTALAQVACGDVVASSSLGREFTRSREPKVLMSTLRALEAKGLAERTARSARAAYIGGPPLDRVRLTSAGITALASAIGAMPNTGLKTRPRPLPATAQATTRSR